ncbi:MAG: alpha-L-fucosidase [Bryobacteraceae bacterium]
MNRRTAMKLLASLPAAGARAAEGRFNASWDSLKQYRCPDWFRDAKFGIWAHWGPQCVPEQGAWYARDMYIEGSPDYKYHVAHYGHPSKFGYKDIVPLWRAENFDPESLMERYQKAGAKYFVALGVHHDNFDCWNSRFHKWNATKMGPKRDIVGMWREAALSRGMRFGVSEHLARSWSWFNVNKGKDKEGPYAGVPYDGNDPAYADFYFEPHEDTSRVYPANPPEAWKKQWLARIKDLVDSYQPDLLYTDGGIPFGEVGRTLVAHFYNRSLEWHAGKLEAVYNIKNFKEGHGEYQDGCCVLDVERGVVDDIRPEPWQTDTCIGNWFYRRGVEYKSARTVIHMLADIVSKNGNLLLNFPQRADGTLDAQAESVLDGVTRWMAVNAEAIHGTRPHRVFGEGPTQNEGGAFSERKRKEYTPEDIRYTTKGRMVYAICLGVPGAQATLRNAPQRVRRVHMLGAAEPLKFTMREKVLRVELPERKPSEHALVLRIA